MASSAAAAADAPWASFAASYANASVEWLQETSNDYVNYISAGTAADYVLSNQLADDDEGEQDQEALHAYTLATGDDNAPSGSSSADGGEDAIDTQQEIADEIAGDREGFALTDAADTQSVALAEADQAYLQAVVPAEDSYAIGVIKAEAALSVSLGENPSYDDWSAANDAEQQALEEAHAALISAVGVANVVWTQDTAQDDADYAVAQASLSASLAQTEANDEWTATDADAELELADEQADIQSEEADNGQATGPQERDDQAQSEAAAAFASAAGADAFEAIDNLGTQLTAAGSRSTNFAGRFPGLDGAGQ